mmetsp:Transcript_2629/g.6255  ORF Transcript_2629/g.6255 Transcript_2629/m.6255 type:complete len:256 (-) Transcript_2629:485-1252(-)
MCLLLSVAVELEAAQGPRRLEGGRGGEGQAAGWSKHGGGTAHVLTPRHSSSRCNPPPIGRGNKGLDPLISGIKDCKASDHVCFSVEIPRSSSDLESAVRCTGTDSDVVSCDAILRIGRDDFDEVFSRSHTPPLEAVLLWDLIRGDNNVRIVQLCLAYHFDSQGRRAVFQTFCLEDEPVGLCAAVLELPCRPLAVVQQIAPHALLLPPRPCVMLIRIAWSDPDDVLLAVSLILDVTVMANVVQNVVPFLQDSFKHF